MALVREMAAGPPPTWKSVRNLHALKNFRADIMMHHALPGTSAGAGKVNWDYDTCEPCHAL